MIAKKRLLMVGVLMSVMLMASFACGDEEEVVPEPAAVEVVEEVVAEEESSDAPEYASMKVAELKELLKAAGKPVSGKKDELIARLME